MYCWADYGLDKEGEEAILHVLTSKHQGLQVSDVEDRDLARFCEAKQDRPCRLRCPKHRERRGKHPWDGENHPMTEQVAPAGLGGGDTAAVVGSFREVSMEIKVDEDPRLLPVVVPSFPVCCSPILLPVCPLKAPYSPRFSARNRTSTGSAS